MAARGPHECEHGVCFPMCLAAWDAAWKTQTWWRCRNGEAVTRANGALREPDYALALDHKFD